MRKRRKGCSVTFLHLRDCECSNHENSSSVDGIQYDIDELVKRYVDKMAVMVIIEPSPWLKG